MAKEDEVPELGANSSGMAVTPAPPQTAMQANPLPKPNAAYLLKERSRERGLYPQRRDRSVRAPGKFGGKYRRVWSKKLKKYYIKYGDPPIRGLGNDDSVPSTKQPQANKPFPMHGSSASHTADGIIKYDGKSIERQYGFLLEKTLYEKLIKAMVVAKGNEENTDQEKYVITYGDVTNISAEILDKVSKADLSVIDASGTIVFSKNRTRTKLGLELKLVTHYVAQYITIEHMRVNDAVQKNEEIADEPNVINPDENLHQQIHSQKPKKKSKKLGLSIAKETTSQLEPDTFNYAKQKTHETIDANNHVFRIKSREGFAGCANVFMQIYERAFAEGLHCLNNEHLRLAAKLTDIPYSDMMSMEQEFSNCYTEIYGKELSERIAQNVPVPTMHPQIDPLPMESRSNWGYGHFNEEGNWEYGTPILPSSPIILARPGRFQFGQLKYVIAKDPSSPDQIVLKILPMGTGESASFVINSAVGADEEELDRLQSFIANLPDHSYSDARFWELPEGNSNTYLLNPPELENPFGLTVVAEQRKNEWNVKIWNSESLTQQGWVMERSLPSDGTLVEVVIPEVNTIVSEYIAATIISNAQSVANQSFILENTQIPLNNSAWIARGNFTDLLDAVGLQSGQGSLPTQKPLAGYRRTQLTNPSKMEEYTATTEEFEKFISIKYPNKKIIRALFQGSKYHVDAIMANDNVLVINICANDGLVVDTRKMENFDPADIENILKMVVAKSHYIGEIPSYEDMGIQFQKGISDIRSENFISPEEETISRIQVNSFAKPQSRFYDTPEIKSSMLYSPVPIPRTPYTVITKIRNKNSAGNVQAEYALQTQSGQIQFRYKDDYPQFVPPARVAQVVQSLTDIAIWKEKQLKKSAEILVKSLNSTSIQNDINLSIYPLSERIKFSKVLFEHHLDSSGKNGLVGNEIEIPISALKGWKVNILSGEEKTIDTSRNYLENLYKKTQDNEDQHWIGALLFALNSCDPKYREENIFTAIKNKVIFSMKKVSDHLDTRFTGITYSFLIPNAVNGFVVSLTIYETTLKSMEKQSEFSYFWQTDEGDPVKVPTDKSFYWKIELFAADNERKAVVDCLSPEDALGNASTVGELFAFVVPEFLKIYSTNYRFLSESTLNASPMEHQLFFSLPDEAKEKDKQSIEVPVMPDCCMMEYYNEHALRKWISGIFPSLNGMRQSDVHENIDVLTHLINSTRLVDKERSDGYCPANDIYDEHDLQLLRITMLLHDIGKASPEDGGVGGFSDLHAEVSADLAKKILPMFGLSENESNHVLYWIKNHELIGNAMKGDFGDLESTVNHIYNNVHSQYDLDMLYHVFRCDVDSIPQFSLSGQAYGINPSSSLGKTAMELVNIAGMKLIQHPKEQKAGSRSKPFVNEVMSTGTRDTVRDLHNPDLKINAEYVQKPFRFQYWRMENASFPQKYLPGYDKYAKTLYNQVKNSPQFSFSKSFGMSYDGSTGKIVRGFVFVSKNDLENIFAYGMLPKENIDSAEGVEIFYNSPVEDIRNRSLFEQQFSIGKNCIIVVDYHSGKTTKWSNFIEREDADFSFWRKWKASAIGGQTMALHTFTYGANVSKAALDMGYNTIFLDGEAHEGNKILCLDPARIALITAFELLDGEDGIRIDEKNSSVKFLKINTKSMNGQVDTVFLPKLSEKEIAVSKNHPLFIHEKRNEDGTEQAIVGSGGLWNGSPGTRKKYE